MQASRAISHRLCVPPCLSLLDTTNKSPSWDSGRSEDVRMQHEPLLWGWAAAAHIPVPTCRAPSLGVVWTCPGEAPPTAAVHPAQGQACRVRVGLGEGAGKVTELLQPDILSDSWLFTIF